MRKKLTSLDLLIGAVLKLDPHKGQRQNVFAFIQSCYCGRVRSYDLDRAMAALAKLSEEEQHALIAWAVVNDEALSQHPETPSVVPAIEAPRSKAQQCGHEHT